MFRIAALTATLALAGCTGVPNTLDTTALYNAGGSAGSGGVCAYYSGNRNSGRLGLKESFRRRACFPTRGACNAWLYRVQSQFPVTYLRKGCGS